MSDNLSILLTVEAVDRASAIFSRVNAALDSMGARIKAASAEANRSAEELQVMQDRAAASATAYSRSLEEQATAQAALRTETASLTLAQEQYAAAARTATGATTAQADAVKAAAAAQVTALDAVVAADTEVAARSRMVAESQAAMATSMDIGRAAMKGAAIASGAVAIAAAVIGEKSIKAAGDFQAGMLKMETSAGESKAKLDSVSASMLQLSIDTATSTSEIVKGLYFVESAGYHAADATTVMRSALEGARAEGADTAEVANALTTAMKDFGYSANDSTKVMDMMVAAVSEGKMTMQQFSTALATVLPIAHATGMSFAETAGAIATMTAQGVSAEQSTTNLAHLFNKLQQPTIDMTKYMAQLGINSMDLSTNLGKKGLAGTLQELLTAIGNHVQGGKVLVSAFNQSKVAAQDLQTMLTNMPPTLRNMSEAMVSGSMSTGDYIKAIKELSGPQYSMGMQFKALMGTADGFNQMLKSGQPAALTFNAALKKTLGDATSLQAAMLLTNGGLKSFQGAAAGVAAAAQNTGKHIENWSDIQGSFNFKMTQLKDAVRAAEISIGTGLLPVVSAIASKVAAVVLPMAEWMEHHQKLSAAILASLLVFGTLIATVLTIVLVIEKVKLAFEALGLAMDFLEANPIILVLTGIALVAILIATHWSQTMAILSAIWNWLVGAAKNTADFFVGVWNGVVKGWEAIWGQIGGTVKGAWSFIMAPINSGISAIVSLFVESKKTVGNAFSAIWDWLVSIWNSSGGKLTGYISHGWGVVSASVSQEWNLIVSKLEEIWGNLTQLWNATGGKLVSIISSHWNQISAVTKIEWNAIWSVIKLAWNEIYAVISGAIKIIVDVVVVAWDVIWTATKMVWDVVWGLIKAAWDIILAVIKVALDAIWAIIKIAWDTILLVFEVAWDTIKFIINTALDVINNVIKIFVDVFTGHWSKMWNDIRSATTQILGDVGSWIKSIFGDLVHWLSGIMNSIVGFIVGGWHAIWNGVSGFVSDIWSGIKSAFSTGMKALGGIWNELKKLAADPINFVIDTVYNNGIRSLWNMVSGVFGGPQLGSISPINFAEGGQVPGIGNRDSVPAMLMPGEFVLSHDMIRGLGGMGAVLAMLGGSPGTNTTGHYGLGGIINSVVGFVQGHLRDGLLSSFNSLNSMLGGIGGTGFSQLLVGGLSSMENGLLSFLGLQDSSYNAAQAAAAAKASSGAPSVPFSGNGGTYGFANGTWDTGSFSQMALLHPHEAVLPASVAGGARGSLGGAVPNVNIDLRGSTFSTQQQMDQMINKMEKRIATWIVPAAGIRIGNR